MRRTEKTTAQRMESRRANQTLMLCHHCPSTRERGEVTWRVLTRSCQRTAELLRSPCRP